MIEQLTPEQEALIPVIRDKFLDYVFKYQLLNQITEEEVTVSMKRIYEICNLKPPEMVYLLDSPRAVQKKAVELTGSPQSFSTYVNAGDFGWLAYYDYFLNHIGVEIEIDQKMLFNETMKITLTCFASVQLDKACIVSKFPSLIKRDNLFQLHCTDGPAVEFLDNEKYYFVHGRNVSEQQFLQAQDMKTARKLFDSTDNADLRGIIVTIIRDNFGPNGTKKFLKAELIDETTIKHAGGYDEIQRLYRTKEKYDWASDSKGQQCVPLAWNEMVCPSTGTVYMIETCPTFNSVIESAKFLRPKNIPVELPYLWNSAS